MRIEEELINTAMIEEITLNLTMIKMKAIILIMAMMDFITGEDLFEKNVTKMVDFVEEEGTEGKEDITKRKREI